MRQLIPKFVLLAAGGSKKGDKYWNGLPKRKISKLYLLISGMPVAKLAPIVSTF